MENNSRVTQKLIAERTGLSMATIDRAINNRGNVKPETLRKIQEASKELGYVVNKSASLLSRKGNISIAVVLLVYPNWFWKKIEESILKAYTEFRDFGLNIEIFRLADSNFEKCVDLVRNIVDSGQFHALALPAWHDAFVDVIDESIEKGFPVCTFNLDAPTSKRLFYVGCNYNVAGKMAAELLYKLIGGEGEVALFTDSWTSFQSLQKIAGFRDALLEYPSLKLSHLIKIERNSTIESLSQLGEKLKTIDGIYVSNAELESIAELKSSIKNQAMLIGHDLNDVIYQQLKNGTIAATICQDSTSQGYLTIKKLFNHLILNDEIDIKENITKLEIVMKENAKYYL